MNLGIHGSGEPVRPTQVMDREAHHADMSAPPPELSLLLIWMTRTRK